MVAPFAKGARNAPQVTPAWAKDLQLSWPWPRVASGRPHRRHITPTYVLTAAKDESNAVTALMSGLDTSLWQADSIIDKLAAGDGVQSLRVVVTIGCD
jgi:hypothetical protein